MAIVEPRKEIELSAFEVVYLNDSISAGDVALGLREKDAYFTCARETLVLLAGAWNEVVPVDGNIDPSASVVLAITEEMAWLFKSKVLSSTLAPDNQTNIGLTLLRKIHQLLLDFKADDELGDISMLWPTSIERPPPFLPPKFGPPVSYAKGSNDAHPSTYQGAHQITDDDAGD